MERPVVSVIIISYNTRAMTLECLKSVHADLASMPAEVIVIDNASKDGSPAAIRQDYPETRVIENTSNSGFGAANNQGMRLAAGEFFLLLNSDAFPEQGAIGAMIDCLQRHPNAAMVGPRLLNGDGSLQVSCYRFPSPARAWLENLWISALFPRSPVLGDYRQWPHDIERPVDWIIGACIMLRREIFEKTGGFDETFFMYQEEADWQRAVRDMGFEIMFTPTSRVKHLGGASGANEVARVNASFFESLDYYQKKHHGMLGVVLVRMAMVLGCFMRGLLWLGVLALIPSRRSVAKAKTRLHGWLMVRQTTCWRLPQKRAA